MPTDSQPDAHPPARREAAPPTPAGATPSEVVEHFFRHESGRLHGALMRLLGPGHLALVEDVAQAALLQAMRTWAIGGIPPNPSAWITRVAINLARDSLRHQRMSAGKEAAVVVHFEQLQPPVNDPREDEIRDDALRLMFVCCHPVLAPDAQVVLALKVLCGFSTGEIARAFLSSEAAIEKQLTRTKQRIRDAGVEFDLPPAPELGARLDGVLGALYLLFNEGYKASSGDQLVRADLCAEAIRLTTLLTQHPAGGTPRSHALLALMLLTAARFPTRLNEQGELVRLEEQDRSKWDGGLIARGLVELQAAADGSELSEYHLQAGIAALHCTAPDAASTDWDRILRHYDELYRIKPSPVVALNRAVALSRVAGPTAALDALRSIEGRERLETHYLFHAVEGDLQWQLQNPLAAAASYRRALQLAAVGPEQLYLTKMLARAESR